MLTKNIELEFDPNKPFEDDVLERKEIAENLTILIKTIKQPFVLSVSSPWGTGKTFFLKRWKAQMELEDFTCIYFNAWENDFAEEPLVAFIGEIETKFSENQTKKESSIEKLKESSGKILGKLTPLALKMITRGALENVEELKDIFDSNSEKDIGNFISKLAKEQIENYQNKKQSISDFKNSLSEFAEKIRVEKKNEFPIVIFIDELDRCRPDYAIKLLEVIKHLFNVEGFVFVLGIDKEQIAQSVKSMFGLETKEDGYLRKFIDLDFQLPEPKIENFSAFLFDSFKISEIFLKDQAIPIRENLLMTLSEFSNFFQISLRQQEQCFIKINLVLRTTKLHNFKYDVGYIVFLVLLKNKEPKLYLNFINNKILFRELISSLKNNYKWASLEKKEEFKEVFHSIIFLTEYFKLERNRKQKLAQEIISSIERGDSDRFKVLKYDLCKKYFESKINEKIINAIEITENFVVK